MTALNDLTWQQLAEQLPADAIKVGSNGQVIIDTSLVTSTSNTALTELGVVKFFSVLFSAANKAQIAANESQADGEKLTTFNPATIGNAVDGYISLTRSFTCRAELATANIIIGSSN